ncbi:Rubredoxin-2 [compost metagenome]
MRRAVFRFYKYRLNTIKTDQQQPLITEEPAKKRSDFLYQCNSCLTVYNEKTGDEAQGILPGTTFKDLPDKYCCPLCEGDKRDFSKIDQSALQLL